jgi:hypothetical protein
MSSNSHDDVHTYEGILSSAATSKKRSLANHLVDYVKKSKHRFPSAILSPARQAVHRHVLSTMSTHPPILSQASSSLSRVKQLQRGKLPSRHRWATVLSRCSYRLCSGSLCVAFSLSHVNELDHPRLNLHGRRLVVDNESNIALELFVCHSSYSCTTFVNDRRHCSASHVLQYIR